MPREVRVHELEGGVAGEGRAAREHLVQRGPERIQIRAGVDCPSKPARLLGGEVLEGTDHPIDDGRAL